MRHMQATIKTPAEQEQMRVAGRLAADVLAELERREGLSGLEEIALRKAQARDNNPGQGEI